MARFSRKAVILLAVFLCHCPYFQARKLSVMDVSVLRNSDKGDFSRTHRFLGGGLGSVPSRGVGHRQVLQPAVSSRGTSNADSSSDQSVPSPSVGNRYQIWQSDTASATQINGRTPRSPPGLRTGNGQVLKSAPSLAIGN